MDPFSYLFSLEQFGIKFGLDNIAAIVDRLGRPDRAYRTIHIAGTNGKGSVTAMVDAALRAAGHRSARYTSPHLVDLSERFVIDGRPIATDALAKVIADVRDVVETLRGDGTLEVQPTFFEVTTAVALEAFRRAMVDVAVLEVGLGGRLDATNVVAPSVTAITSIAFDHQLYLGSTLEDIAMEKAGIVKAHVPVVIGVLDEGPLAVIEQAARDRGAPLVRTSADDVSALTVALAGTHQRANAAIALAVLRQIDAQGIRVPDAAIAEGFAHPMWPGRLDRRRLADGREVLLDAAHNPAGAAALASFIKDAPAPMVFAAMRDKDVDGMFRELLPAISALVVTRARNPRSADPASLADRARTIAPMLPIAIEPAIADALAAAWRRSPRIVVAGSIFLLGDVMRLLQLKV
ncbi:MAG TPA: cyanophycin synthetase [Vicinamibacterales bacterium]|nr:cyanophycin synthetase [Vicinamibacterales bacterium]